jgi:hypothetical protein
MRSMAAGLTEETEENRRPGGKIAVLPAKVSGWRGPYKRLAILLTGV